MGASDVIAVRSLTIRSKHPPRRARLPRFSPLAALLALCLAGCGGWDNFVLRGVNNGSPALVPEQWDRIDGNYKGAVVQVAARSPGCPGDSFGKLEIGDGGLFFAYAPDTFFIAPIRPDGTLYSVSGPARLEGSLVEGRLRFTVRTPLCVSRYNMRRVL